MSGPATSAPEPQRTAAAELMQSAPLASNTALTVYSDYNLGLRVPTNVRLSWRDTQADTVLADALKAIVDGCGVVGDRVPRPFANYDWTHYSDEIGSLFAYFWILLFSVQYAAVQGSGNDIQKAWRFFRIQTKQWFERAGFFATEWMDGAVRKLDSAAAVARFDAQLRALQTAYLSGRGLRLDAKLMDQTYQEQLRTVQAYDTAIAELAALSSVEIVESQPKLDVLQQIVQLQRDEAVQKRDRLLQTMPLPESLLTGLRRLIVPSVAPKKFLDEIGTLKAEAIVAKSTIKNLEQRLGQSELAKANDALQKEVAALRQQLAKCAEKVASSDQLDQKRLDLATASATLATKISAATMPPNMLDHLRAAAPRPGRTIDAATQKVLDDYNRLKVEAAMEKANNQELQKHLNKYNKDEELTNLRTRVADLQQKLIKCQEINTDPKELRKVHDDLKNTSTTLATKVSAATMPTDMLDRLRAAAPRPGRTIDAATQKVLDDYNRLKVEAAMEKANNQELQKRLSKYNENEEITRLRAQTVDLQQKLFKCQESNTDLKELRKMRDELKQVSTTLAETVSVRAIAPDALAALRDAAPKPGRTIDAATQRILDDYNRLKVEAAMEKANIQELQKRLNKYNENEEIVRLRAQIVDLQQKLFKCQENADPKELRKMHDELKNASTALAVQISAATLSPGVLDRLRMAAPKPGRTIDEATQRILDSYGEMQVKLRIQESTIAELQRSLSGSKLTTKINDLRKKLAECTAKTASAESSAKLLNELRTASATLADTGAVAGLIDPALLAALRQTVPTRPPPGTTPQLVEAYGKLKAEASVQKATISELERRLAVAEMKESKESALQKAADDCRQRLTEYELNAIDDAQRRSLLAALNQASEFFAANVAQSALPPDTLRALRAAEPSERLVAAYEEIIKKLRIDIGEREAKLIVQESTIKELRKQLSPSLTSAPSLPGTVAPSSSTLTSTVAPRSSTLAGTVAPNPFAPMRP